MTVRFKRTCMRSFRMAMYKLKLKGLRVKNVVREDVQSIGTLYVNNDDIGRILKNDCEHVSNGQENNSNIFKTNTPIEICQSNDQTVCECHISIIPKEKNANENICEGMNADENICEGMNADENMNAGENIKETMNAGENMNEINISSEVTNTIKSIPAEMNASINTQEEYMNLINTSQEITYEIKNVEEENAIDIIQHKNDDDIIIQQDNENKIVDSGINKDVINENSPTNSISFEEDMDYKAFLNEDEPKDYQPKKVKLELHNSIELPYKCVPNIIDDSILIIDNDNNVIDGNINDGNSINDNIGETLVLIGNKMKVFETTLINTLVSLNNKLINISNGGEEAILKQTEKIQESVINECATILNNFHCRASEKLAGLNISKISKSISEFIPKIGLLLDEKEMKINNLEALLKDKENEIKNMSNEYHIIQTKANMLEESCNYFNKQNDFLKEAIHNYILAINIIKASTNNLKKLLNDVSSFKNELFEAYISNRQMNIDNFNYLDLEFIKIKERLAHAKESISNLNVQGKHESLLKYVEDVLKQYDIELSYFKPANEKLMENISNLNSEILELKEKNDNLLIVNKELKEEIELKESYSKDLERSTDDLIKSAKFYEDQLIVSDNLIKSLKESKAKSYQDFSGEIEKIRKLYLKENGMLKLRIEELENELLDNNNK